MKKLFLPALMLLGGVLHVHAQADTSKIDLDELRPPSSPGFSILGVQPTEVARPKSLKALETTLTNAFFDGNRIVLPKNFAMEVNPYLALRGENVAVDTAEFFDEKNKPGDVLWRNLSISAATGQFPSYRDTSQENSRMGLGARTQISWMRSPDAAKSTYRLQLAAMRKNLVNRNTVAAFFQNAVTQLESDNALIAAKADEKKLIARADSIVAKGKADLAANPALAQMINDYGKVLKSKLEQTKTGEEALELYKNEVQHIDEYLELAPLARELQDRLDDKYGWELELAAAAMLDFPTDEIAYSTVPKIAGWGILTYRNQKQNFEFGLLARYMSAKFDTTLRTNNFDFGGRLTLQGSKWSISGEFIQRAQMQLIDIREVGGQTITTTAHNLDFKAGLNVNYKISEQLIINYNFGNNFSVGTELPGDGKLMSTLGIAYALGGPTIRNLSVN